MKVWILTYDWGCYGAGIDSVYATEEMAEKAKDEKEKRNAYARYSIEEEIVIGAE